MLEKSTGYSNDLEGLRHESKRDWTCSLILESYRIAALLLPKVNSLVLRLAEPYSYGMKSMILLRLQPVSRLCKR